MRLLPGATVLDIQEAITGENAVRPGIELSGTEQAASAANASMFAVVALAAKITRLAKNCREGQKFEKEMGTILEELGQLGNEHTLHQLFRVVQAGKIKRTFPDITVQGQAMIEIKRVLQLDLTTQFQRQIQAVKDNPGMRYRIIVSDILEADGIHNSLKQALQVGLLDNGISATIEKYDSAQRILVRIWP